MSTHTPFAGGASLPSVSVIVPIYNAAATLPTTLPSWLGQDHRAEWILVDDGSTDGTGDLLASIVDVPAGVRVLTHGDNRGRAAARNTGIAAASGDVLLFLDADMRPAPDFVRQHADLHRSQEVVGIVSNPVLEDLDPTDPYHRYLQSRRGAAGYGVGRPLPFKYFIIGYTSVKADAVATVGGFDERLSYGEDLDFAYRLSQHFPDSLRYSDRPVVHHYDHGNLDARLAKLREFGRDNLPILLAKHPALARAANVDFVDSRSRASTWRTTVKRLAVQPALAEPIKRLIPYAPRAVSNLVVRYVLAASLSAAYRDATSSS